MSREIESGNPSLLLHGNGYFLPSSEPLRSGFLKAFAHTDRQQCAKGGSLGKILIVDDEVNQRSALAGILAHWGYSVVSACNGSDALVRLRSFEADIVITDLNMPVLDGKGLLSELAKSGNSALAIVLTGFGSVEAALETVHRLGAFWYIEKPVQPAALKMILERAMEKRQLATEGGRYGQSPPDVTGASAAMKEVWYLLGQVAPTRATVLITGESGTGKEVAARAIHRLSTRAQGPFFALNCAAMPEGLMESELFGHEKGAFTGAAERRAGCFELATGGTLLLDEIGDMAVNTQAKLLRVLEDRQVRRLGAAKTTEVDVRVVAATNHNLRDSIAKGTFREDLYFRLNVFEIHLPPLRRRREDIPALSAQLITDLNTKHKCHVIGLEPEVVELFQAYNWAGNIRELRNILERAVILAAVGEIGVGHLPRGFAGEPAVDRHEAKTGDSLVLQAGVTVDAAERALIELTLRHTGGNRTKAAEALGISAKTLFNKLKEYEGTQ